MEIDLCAIGGDLVDEAMQISGVTRSSSPGVSREGGRQFNFRAKRLSLLRAMLPANDARIPHSTASTSCNILTANEIFLLANRETRSPRFLPPQPTH